MGHAEAEGQAGPRAPAEHRRRLPAVPTLVVLAIVGTLGALLFLRSRPEQQVLRLVDAQVKLAKAVQAATSPEEQEFAFDRLYATLGPRAKGACDRDGFFGALLGLPPGFWDLIEYRDLRVRVQGDRAFVTYVVTYNETLVEEATPEDPDLYVRATETVLGPVQSVEERLATLERAFRNEAISPEDYEKQRARIMREGPKRSVLFQRGQWYDELDSHMRC